MSALWILIALVLSGCGEQPQFRQVDLTPCGRGGVFKGELAFRIFLPEQVPPVEGYPMIIFLHGNGEQGNFPVGFGNKSWARYLAGAGAQNKEAFVLLQPRCQKGDVWTRDDWGKGAQVQKEMTESSRLLVDLEAAIEEEYPINPRRIYLVGFSMGGFAVWDLLARYPGKYAAAVAIAGSGDPFKVGAVAQAPIWVFHSRLDRVVPVSGSREMVHMIKKNGGLVTYTEYDDVEHEDTLSKALETDGLLEWILSQKRAD